MGNDSTTNSTTPVSVSGISTAVAISADNEHTCALLQNGTVKCWGDNRDGELGNGGIGTYQKTPVTVEEISTATGIATGYEHTCALLQNGSVKCWGNNGNGELGNGNNTDASIPVTTVDDTALGYLSGIEQITAGAGFSCALE